MGWQPENGRWAALKAAWEAGEPKFLVLLRAVSSIPIWCWPGGEKNYYYFENKFGDETWWAPINLWREIFHLFFGFVLTIGFCPWPKISFILIFVTFAIAWAQEYFTDIPDSGLRFKNILDVSFWTMGAVISNIFSMKFFG